MNSKQHPSEALSSSKPLAEPVVISLYAAADKIYPRSTFGFFTKWRWVMIWLTQIVFYGIPWIEWGQRQALLFDLEARRFYIFNLVLYPQDLIYLTAILIISALSLFLFTAVAGRLWCGYTCPQTVYTEIFLWIETQVEGDRAARMRLDGARMSAKKLFKKAAKHVAWITFALWTGFTFVGYFSPIRELGSDIVSFSLGPWESFWVLFYGFATYGNAGFMREQVCKYMCPYARFQSAMFDDDTLIVTYDEKRGEPRGKVSLKAGTDTSQQGACIDCSLCVQVCPTGIDIRKGLQYECIGCGACADVCDTVMDKVGYARGLVKYSTQNAMDHGWSHQQMLHRILRPRVMIYTAFIVVLVASLITSLWLRSSFRVDVVRDRGVMARMANNGKLENVYRLQIMNATESVQRYALKAKGIEGIAIESDFAEGERKVVSVNPAESRWIPVRLQIEDGSVASGSHKIEFEVVSVDRDETVTEKSVFLVPR